MRQYYVESQPQITVVVKVQGRAGRGKEGNRYGADDEEGENDGGDGRVRDEIEREVRERFGEPGQYRPYVPKMICSPRLPRFKTRIGQLFMPLRSCQFL